MRYVGLSRPVEVVDGVGDVVFAGGLAWLPGFTGCMGMIGPKATAIPMPIATIAIAKRTP
jgi:hypothetical protein